MRDTSYTTSAVIGTTPGPVIAGNAVANDTVSFTATPFDRLVGSDTVLTSGAAVAEKGTTLQDMRQRVSSSTTAGSGTITVTVKGSNADETARVAEAVANATIAQGQADQQAQRTASLTQLQSNRDALRAQLDQMAADAPERAQVDSQFQSVVAQIASQQAAPYDAAQLLQTAEVPNTPLGPGAKSLAIFAFLAVLVLGGEGIVVWTRYRRQRGGRSHGHRSCHLRRRAGRSRRRAGAGAHAGRRGAGGDSASPFWRCPVSSPTPSSPPSPRATGSSPSSAPAISPATNDVTLALGQELAARGFSTLVVEGDMSHPTLASRLSIRSQAGLTDVLSGGATVERTQRQTSIVGLQVLPSGRAVERPDVLIGVDNVQRVLSTSSSDIVVVSLPPSMSPADRDALASQLHSVVVVVRDGRMRSRQVKAALSELEALHNTLVAVGLVDVVPNPEIEIIGRKADRSPRRTASSEPAPIRPSRAAAERGGAGGIGRFVVLAPRDSSRRPRLGPRPGPCPRLGLRIRRRGQRSSRARRRCAGGRLDAAVVGTTHPRADGVEPLAAGCPRWRRGVCP